MTNESEARQISPDIMRRQSLLELMGDLGSGLRSVFECMEIAEEEIETAKQHTPDRAQEIWQSFSYLRPTPILEPLTLRIYRAHARELIERVAQGRVRKRDLEEATAGELCCVFCQASQVQGLNSDATVAYQQLFRQVFPEAPFLDELVIQESYPGRAEEIIGELRWKFRQGRQEKDP